MKNVMIYTDGACANNPYGNGGYGTIILDGEQRTELSGGFQNTTNNRMEMYAVIVGLEALNEPCHATVYSDSKYIVDSLNKRWVYRWQANNWMRNKKEPALNVDLWKRLLELCGTRKVTFQWVRGHAGHPENECCDTLATTALKQENLPYDLTPPGETEDDEKSPVLNPMTLHADTIVSYLETLVNIPSPTGYTKQLEEFLKRNAEEKQIAFQQTRKGAIIYKFEADQGESDIMFAAHVDTLGAIVKEVNHDTLTLSPVGGSPVMYLIGDYCRIHAFDGKTYEGTILPNNPAVHVNKRLKEMEMTFENISVRVDIAMENTRKTLKNYIEVGNFVSLDPKFRYVNDFIKSRHLDDKTSAAILLYVADVLKDITSRLKSHIYLFFNVTEETGQGIAGFPNIDDFIVVDMGVVGNGVAGDEYHVSICMKDSSGPYNYELTQKLIQHSKQHNIAYKTDIFPYYGSDGSAVLRAGSDMRVALIGPGVSASHGYERTHINSLLNTTRLILSVIEEGCTPH